jgi:hypothetical protein
MNRGSSGKKKKQSRPSNPDNEVLQSVEIVIQDTGVDGPSKQDLLNKFLAETSKIRDSHAEH